jgi:hypothetical protein
MRLYELINFEPRDSKKNYGDRVSNNVTPSSKKIGQGHFASAFTHDTPKRLNQVRKSGQAGKIGNMRTGPKKQQSITDDAYLSYLKMIYDFEQKGGQNPFFPKIHDLKIYRDPEGNLDYNVDIEKLHKLNKSGLGDNELAMKQIYISLFAPDKYMPAGEDSIDAYMIMGDLRSIADDGDYDRIIDKNLKQALSMSRDLATKHGFQWDIHADNVMWRITGNIPQLVLTDILA